MSGYAYTIGMKCMFDDLVACYDFGDLFDVKSRLSISWDKDICIFKSSKLPYGWNGEIDSMKINIPDQYRNVMYIKNGKWTRFNINFEV